MKKTVHPGSAFTLIELLIYLALLTCLSLLAFSFAARTYRFMLERTRVHNLFVRSIIAQDLIRRDLQLASLSPADWDVAHNIFKQLTLDDNGKPIERWVGYEVSGKGLARREGFYTRLKGWGQSTVSLVDQQVEQLTLKPIMRQFPELMVVAVTVEIPGQETMTVALRNRVLS